MALRAPNLGPRMRKVLRYAGFALVGLVTFVFALQLTFPFDRVKGKIVDLLSEKYEVTIGDVERGLIPGRVYFKAVSLRTRPTLPDEVATSFYIRELEVDLGLFALLRGAASVDLDAEIGDNKNGIGNISGTIALASSGTSIEIDGSNLPSASLPMREALGLPMSGKVRFAFELELPNEKSKSGKVAPNWARAEGRAEFACPSGCTVGDGKSKLRPKLKNQRQQAFAEDGIDFGKVTIDTLLAVVEIKDSKLSITRFDAKSSDGELHVDLNVALNQEVNSSLVTGCLRFRGSEALQKREPKTHAALTTTGASLGPDNLFHIRLDGPLREVRRLAQICGEASGANNPGMDNPSMPPARPNLSVTPEAAIPQPLPTPSIPPPEAPAMQPLPAPVVPAPPPGPPLDPGSAMPPAPPPSPPPTGEVITLPPGSDGAAMPPAHGSASIQ